jgi:hypothetical protein
MLDELDCEWLGRRRRALRHLGLVTWLLPAVWVVAVVGAGFAFPPLVDPFGIDRRLQTGVVDWALLRTLARLAPALFLVLLCFVTVTLVGYLRVLHRERRLLDMVERARRGSVGPHD